MGFLTSRRIPGSRVSFLTRFYFRCMTDKGYMMNIDDQIPQEEPVEPEKPARKKARTGEGKRKTSVKKAVESGAVETEAEKTPESKPKAGSRRTKKEGTPASTGRKKAASANKEKSAAPETEESALSVPSDMSRPESPAPEDAVAPAAVREIARGESPSQDEDPANARSETPPRPARVSIFFDRPLPAFASAKPEKKAAARNRSKDGNKNGTPFSESGKNQEGKKARSSASARPETRPDAPVASDAPEKSAEKRDRLEAKTDVDEAVAREADRPAKRNRGGRGRGRSRKNSGSAELASDSGEIASFAESGATQAAGPSGSEPLGESDSAKLDFVEHEITTALVNRPSDAVALVAEAVSFAGESRAADSVSSAQENSGIPGANDPESGLEAESGDGESDSVIVEHAGQGEELPPVTMEDLPQALRDAAARAGWNSLMPVQQNALPYGLAARDLMVQSRTGSGKTGAFLLPLLARLDPSEATCQALVLVPTRELALQVEHEASVLFEGTGLVSAAVYGGVGYAKQMEQLRNGAHLVVGTPGRVLDHLLKRTLTLDALRALVFDESDRMLSIGFYPDMKEIQRYLPKRRIPTQLFSATYPPHVLRLSGEFLRDPHMLSLSQNQVHVAQIDHISCECATMEKDRTLVRLIEVENPSSAIIFCNTKSNVHYVTGVLQGFGYNADELSSDLSQAKREEVLGRLRKGGIRFLVATDVAARGIDIPELSHVFLYEPPEDQESYIHRAGRTGRAGAAGTVISIVDVMERLELQRIAKHYKIEIRQRPVPTDDDVSGAVGMRMTAMLEARYRNLTGLQRERARRLLPLIRNMAADEELLNLLAMLLDCSYQEPASLPAPALNGARSGGGSAPRSASSGGGETPSASQKSSRRRRRRKPLKSAPAAE